MVLLGIHTTLPIILIGEVLIGLYVGLVVSPVTTLVLANAPKEQSGIASALFNAARQVGGVLGVALLGTALGSSSDGAGIQIATLIMTGACFVGLLLGISLARQRNA